MWKTVVQTAIVCGVATGCTYDLPGPCLESCIGVHVDGDIDPGDLSRANSIFGPAGIRLGHYPEAGVQIYVEIDGARGRGAAAGADCDGYVRIAADRGPLLFAHEIGHALTLPHRDARGALMRHTYIWGAEMSQDEYAHVYAYVAGCSVK